MRKHVKKIACALALTFLVSSLAPAGQTAYADNKKQFTYAEQETGVKVTSLEMTKGEKVDLKFIGVSDWKNYSGKMKWVSSNTSVATVDSSGLITAVGNGVANVRLVIDNEKTYTSTGVTVMVSASTAPSQTIKIGTSRTNTPYYYSIDLNQTLDLNAYAVTELPSNSYYYDWTSTNPAVATIDSNGKVTPKSNGITVIQLTLTNLTNNKSLSAMPIAIQVGKTTVVAPTATPVPGVTATPVPTATPAPTKVPNATVTPVPSDAYVPYTVEVSSDHSVTLKFTKEVSFKFADMALYQILDFGNETVELKCEIAEAELDSTSKVMTVTAEDFFTSGNTYMIRAGVVDPGKSFSVTYGEPNRIDVTYSCLDRDGAAYAYDDEIGLDVPVELSCKLYHNNVDVTASYKDLGYVYYELVSPQDSSRVDINGESLYFYSTNVTASVKGIFSYMDEDGKDRELVDAVKIVSKAMPAYTITGIKEWTIIDTNDSSLTTIDWDKPVHEAIAGGTGYKVVALLLDSYGNLYSTDYRGVDETKGILSIDDPDALFSYMGYSYEFNASNSNNFILLETGELDPYEVSSRASAYITLYNDMAWSSGYKNIGAFQMRIKEASKLASIKVGESKITLVTNAVNNRERFCSADIPVILYDQYGNVWKGDADLEVSSSTTTIKDYIGGSGGPAYVVEGKNAGEYYLHVDADRLREISERVSNVSLTITESYTGKKDNITVSLKNPSEKDGVITVNSWNVGMEEEVITIGTGDLNEQKADNAIEIYQVSKNGMNVGLLENGLTDENGNKVNIILQEEKYQKFTNKNCEVGDLFVLVLGPDGKVVETADSQDDLGVWQSTTNGNIYVNVSALDSGDNTVSMLAEGKYTVTVTRITKISDKGVVSKSTKSTGFQVVDNTKDVTVRYTKASSISTPVYDGDLEGIRTVITNLFVFDLGGEIWSTLAPEMITDVDFEVKQSYIRIKSIEFAVPADGRSMNDDTVFYKKTIEKVNKTIRIDD